MKQLTLLPEVPAKPWWAANMPYTAPGQTKPGKIIGCKLSWEDFTPTELTVKTGKKVQTVSLKGDTK